MNSCRALMAALMILVAGLCAPACFAQADAPALPQRMRGITLNVSYVTPEVIARAADYGVNVVMFNFHPDQKKGDGPAPTAEDPLIPYKENIKRLHEALAVCRKHNLIAGVCVVPWGRRLDYFWQAEKGDQYRDHLPEFWVAFAKEFKNEPNLVMYDLMGEPNFKEGRYQTWQEDLLPRCVKAVRSVNQRVWLIVEPGPWGLPTGFKTLKPVDDPHVIYDFHMYAPHTYTHQGVGKKPERPRGQVYPGMLKQFPGSPRMTWNKEKLEEYLQPARDFQQKYHVRMFCGEFGVIRWAPGRGQWMKDVISIFENWGFDWSTFSLNGWNGWNPTFPPDVEQHGKKEWFRSYGGLEHSPVLDAWKVGWALNKNEGATTRPAK